MVAIDFTQVCQKRPITVSKETYYSVKRDLLLCLIMVAIDFTQSNGDPKSPQSLHFMNPHAFNKYQEAIIHSKVCAFVV